MKKKKKVRIISVAVLVLALFIARVSQRANLQTLEEDKFFYVERIVDGDTIILSNKESLRYIGIDTPEIRRKERGEWVYDPLPYGEEASEFNRSMVERKKVRLEFDVQKRDKYKRLLAYVYTEDGLMVNLEMLRRGYAMLYTYPPNVKYVEKFVEAQKVAREAGAGLWGDLEENLISSGEARHYIGKLKMVEAVVQSTFLSDKVLIMNFRDNFKAVIFSSSFSLFPKIMQRSPDSFLKQKTVRVYGLIKEYKGASEIIISNPAQLEILE